MAQATKQTQSPDICDFDMAQPHPSKPTALITGGARRIGALIAEHLAKNGYDLVLHYHRSNALGVALAEKLRAAYGCEITLRQADLREPASLSDFWKGLPACHLLIHNASQFERDTMSSLTPESLRTHLAVHLESPLLLSQGFLAQLPKESSGNIIVLGDGTMGWSIAPQFFSYAISKHAWHAAIDILAAACAPKVRANLVTLGATLSGSVDDETVFAKLIDRAPLKRKTDPKEVLTAIDFLLSAPGVTGQVISLANGFGITSARPV